MRPHELDVTLHLDQVVVNRTEDSGGDEPYLWVLGFKVDADTIDPPAVGSLVPTIRVETVTGAPSMPWLVGAGSVDAPATLTVPAGLGTRNVHLRPALIDGVGWFDGLAGIVALLWDQDAFDPSTSEAGHATFNRVFGPAVATELRTMLQGDPGYDAALGSDAAGNPLPPPAGGFSLPWRVTRMSDPAGMKNAVRELTRRVKDAIRGSIRSALADAAGWDELVDPDDLLGADAAVFTGRQLSGSPQPISLRFTDDDADYEVKGGARGARVRQHSIVSSVVSSVSTYAGSTLVSTHVCWFPTRIYVATATRLATTTRFQLVTLAGGPPAQVRWFVDGVSLDGPGGTVPIQLDGVGTITGSPARPLADSFPAGPGTLAYVVSGTTLDLSSVAGDGVWSGRVRAIVAYPGDPTLTPPFPVTSQEVWDRGYELGEDVSVVTLEVQMDADYVRDLTRCLRTVKDIDLKRIPVVFGPLIDPGDPHPDWSTLQETAREQERLVALVEQRGSDGPERTGQGWFAEELHALDALRSSGLVTNEEVATIRARVIMHR